MARGFETAGSGGCHWVGLQDWCMRSRRGTGSLRLVDIPRLSWGRHRDKARTVVLVVRNAVVLALWVRYLSLGTKRFRLREYSRKDQLVA